MTYPECTARWNSGARGSMSSAQAHQRWKDVFRRRRGCQLKGPRTGERSFTMDHGRSEALNPFTLQCLPSIVLWKGPLPAYKRAGCANACACGAPSSPHTQKSVKLTPPGGGDRSMGAPQHATDTASRPLSLALEGIFCVVQDFLTAVQQNNLHAAILFSRYSRHPVRCLHAPHFSRQRKRTTPQAGLLRAVVAALPTDGGAAGCMRQGLVPCTPRVARPSIHAPLPLSVAVTPACT